MFEFNIVIDITLVFKACVERALIRTSAPTIKGIEYPLTV